MIGQRIARYEVLELLGEGGMGLVYKARDINLDRFVALKVLHPKSADNPSRIRRFAQEAKAASALNHPNIITVHEIDKVPGGPDFIVMEFIDGQTLHALAATAVPIPSLISIARQAAEALAVAHSHGIIHRDIKPENIMVRHDGYVKVLDFGLARLSTWVGNTLLTSTEDTAAGNLAGTPAFMSPEQTCGDALTDATDIFSLGLVLYKLATGQHPYPAFTRAALLHAIYTQIAAPPSRLRPEIPGPLDELILAMLEKNPRRRPRAAAIVAALSERKSEAAKAPIYSARSASPSTVGRGKELAELHSSFEAASAGNGLLLCVTGESGIGKTTLIEEFLSEASDSAACIGRGRCSERLAGAEAYLPILEALENLVRTPLGAQLAHLLKLLAPTWYLQVAPSTRDSSDQFRAEAQGASQERMKREITSFFQEVSRIRPLILFFDDLHWADPSTVDILSYLGDRCRSMRLLILTTYRPSDLLLSKHPFHQVKLELQARGACREIPVGFLDASEIETYLANAFSGHRFPSGFAALVHSRTEGNPLFMVDLLRYLRDRGVLVEAPDGGKWTLSQSVEDIAIGLPESVRSMIQRKIERLGDDDRRLVVGASVQGYEFDSAALAAALQIDAADVEERLEVLERVHGFVRQLRETSFPDGTPSLRYQFVHVLYQNALYESLRPTRRASLSGALAQALVRLYGEMSEGIAAELAFLFETAREPARAIDYYLLASQHAAKVSAYREVENLARRGIELLPNLKDPAERSQREVLLFVALSTSLSSLRGYADPEVEATCSRAAALCRDSEDRLEIFASLTGLAAVNFMRPNLRQGLEAMQRLVPAADASPHPAMRTSVHLLAGAIKGHTGDLKAALQHQEAAIRSYDPSLHMVLLLNSGFNTGIVAHAYAGLWAWHLGFPERSKAYADHALVIARQLPHAHTLAHTLHWLCLIAHYQRDASRCAELAAELHSVASENAFLMLLGWGGPVYGWAEAEAGRLDQGIQRIEQGLELNRRTGAELMRPEHLALLAQLLARRGSLDRALSTLDEALGTAEATAETYCIPEFLRLKADLMLQQSTGLAPKSETLLKKSLKIARQIQARSFELRAATSLGRLLRDCGRKEEARDLLSGIYGQFTEGFDTPDLLDAAALLSSLR